MKLAAFRERFTPLFTKHIASELAHLAEDYRVAYHELDETRAYMRRYADGGKRVRPYLVWLFYTWFGGKDTQLGRQIGIAHELVHMWALVHDDIIDAGKVRRNIPAYHIHTAKLYDNEHIGEAQAMLVGDMLLQRAIKQFVKNTSQQDVHHQFFTMLNELIYGESLDVHLSHTDLQQELHPITLKDELKTTSYTFLRPMLIGAKLAGHQETETISELAYLLGGIYQMRDDLLDITADHTNKTCLSDLQEWNQTVILSFALANLTWEDKETLLDYRGRTLTSAELDKAQELFARSWAIDTTKKEINRLLTKASQQLKKLDTKDDRIQTGIADIIDYLTVT